ncbi:MAG: DUF222 domain-containing protein, partial [Actinotalea sp.]|nr:DUF222 domain-containing protein [Actinotalea sp.]
MPFDRERAVLDHRVGPVGRLLVDVEGGPGLVGALRELEGWAADPGSLVEVVAAYERVAAWARSRAVAAAARLAATPEMNPHWPATVGTPAATAAAATELSLRLGVSRRTGDTFVAMGRALDGLHAGTGDALAAGRLDWPRARVLVEALEHVAPAVALEVEDKVLARAEAMTTTQLRREVARVLEEIDPEDAADRHAHARTRRHVSRPRALPDGMASMTAVLTVEAAVRLDACLQAAADGARHDGDPRTVDQLRADALDAMGEVAWLQGAIGPVPSSVGTPADQSAAATRPDLPVRAAMGSRMPLRGPAGGRPRINVTVGIGTLLGLDDRPGELAGYGPIGADVARRLAVDGTWRRLLVDEPSG